VAATLNLSASHHLLGCPGIRPNLEEAAAESKDQGTPPGRGWFWFGHYKICRHKSFINIIDDLLNKQLAVPTSNYIISNYIYHLFFDSRGKIGRPKFWKLKSSSAFETCVPGHFFEQCSDDAHEIQESLPAFRCQPPSSSSSWWSWVVATRQGFHWMRLLGHATGTQCQKICPDGKHIFLSKTFSRPNKAWKINPQNRSVTQVGSTQLLYTENLKISENCTQPIVETAMHLPNQLFGLDFLTFVVQPLTQSPPGPSLGLTNSWVIPGDGIGASLEATANWASVWPLARPFAVQQGVVWKSWETPLNPQVLILVGSPFWSTPIYFLLGEANKGCSFQ